MRNPQGYAVIIDPEAPTQEADTFTCGHCNRIVFVPPRASPADSGGWCGRCTKLVCAPCSAGDCTPFEKKLEAMERRDRMLRAVGVVGG